MSSPKILVFGSTGTTGFSTSKALSDKGVPFRAAIHKSADKLKGLKNYETAEVDIYNPESVRAALKGIEKVFLMAPPGQTKSVASVVPLLKEAGVKYVVKLSALGSEEKDPNAFIWAHQHAQIEEQIKEAGIPLTSLRPSGFFTNVLNDKNSIKGQSTIYSILGEAKMNWISVEDIGEVAATCLTEEGHAGKEYYLTGPDSLTVKEVADLWSSVLGRTINVVPIDDAALRNSAKGYLPTQELIDEFSNMFKWFTTKGYDKKFDDVEKVLHKKPRSLKPFLESIKQDFQ